MREKERKREEQGGEVTSIVEEGQRERGERVTYERTSSGSIAFIVSMIPILCFFFFLFLTSSSLSKLFTATNRKQKEGKRGEGRREGKKSLAT